VKTISLRKFRNEIVDLHEPVEVMRRERDGNIQILGSWTPYMTSLPGSVSVPEAEPGEDVHASVEVVDLQLDAAIGPRIIRTPEEAATVAPISPLRAVPKPSQRRKSR